MKKYKAIIWDFNGTLIDDVKAALGAVNDMLLKRAQPKIDINKYYDAVDTPIWKFYQKVFVPDTITPEEAIAEFATGYEKHLSPNPLMNGAEDVLNYFKSMGMIQIVVSASHKSKVTEKLRTLGISHYFDTVLALSDYNAGDKTHLAQEYLKDNDIAPGDTLVIGDCVADFQMAASLSADCILTTKGHQSRREFAKTSATIIDELTEIINL